MKTTLPQELPPEIFARIEEAHTHFQKIYPGMQAGEQPVHTYYVAAHLFRADILTRSREAAIASLDEFAPDFISFARAIGLSGAEQLPSRAEAAAIAQSIEADRESARRENQPAWFAHAVYHRVREKLQREPIEDLRIDFEDGYGNRPSDEEDRHAALAASELAAALRSGKPWPRAGIRIKPFSTDLCKRSIRPLDIFLTELATRAGEDFRGPLYITLAKVCMPAEVAALADVCSRIEPMLGLAPGTLRIELMAETTAAILNERGEVNLLPLVAAAGGRCAAVHFGTYDYTAGRQLTAAHQHMLHFACDFAREVMQVALAGTGIWLSDGGTNVLPLPPHRAASKGPLTEQEITDNRATVHRAWKLHFDHVRHSLRNGYYQGWDLDPAQLPTRYAAVISFFLDNIDAAAERLRTFTDNTVTAGTHVSDDAATGQGLLHYIRRAIRCGAITLSEAASLTGFASAELQADSFDKILQGRRG